MTDEEKRELPNIFQEIFLLIDVPNLQTYLHTNIFLYLLKQNFDLFGLIESGLAIDKATLK